MIKITTLKKPIMDMANEFLSKHEESAQFLINNLKTLGPYLGDHHNSGNYKAILKEDKVVGIYCLNKRGNLLIQSEGIVDPRRILDDCIKESLPIKGIIGEWNSVMPVFEAYKTINPEFQPAFFSKEILYRYSLNENDSNLAYDCCVRLLGESDFKQWLSHNNRYVKELGMPSDLTDLQKRKDFLQAVKNKFWWGLFDNNQLIASCAIISSSDSVGQVGGVFTLNDYRRKGYGKTMIKHMLKDCVSIHRHSKSILFTGETDLAALRLYESVGYKRFGSYLLIMS